MFRAAMNLGDLQVLYDRVSAAQHVSPQCRLLIHNLIKRMAEIDGNSVTISAYRELKPGEQDEPPNGDTFNELWNAIQDEICDVIRYQRPQQED